MEKNKSSQFDLVNFLLKTLIIFTAILGSILFLMPDFSSLRKLETDQNKLIVLSLIQNPRVLWKLSEANENKGKIDNAIRDMELAIGLLEILKNTKKIGKLFYFF